MSINDQSQAIVSVIYRVKFVIAHFNFLLIFIAGRTCFLKLEGTGLSELGRLVNIFTKEMVETFDKISDTIIECLLSSENSTVNSNFVTHDFDVTNEQLKCIAVRMTSLLTLSTAFFKFKFLFQECI